MGPQGVSRKHADAALEHAADDEEALDQRVAASRRQIKAWIVALEEGKQAPPPTQESSSQGKGLRPVVPPPKARQSSYSSRLRSTTSHYATKYGS